MGYFNIIDSLSDIKVNEGMVESIPKNKNKDIDNLVKALLTSDIDFIPSKNINSYKSFYNRSSFSKNFVDNVIKWTSLKNKSNNGAKLYMICLGDGGRFLMVFERRRLSRLGRCFVFKVSDESTMESVFELANDGKMSFDVDNPKLDGCKLITDTYCIHGGDIVEDEYIKKFGFAGRSLGCPVLPNSLTIEIIDFIKHGRVLFIYGNDEEYIDESTYLSKLASVFEGSPKNIVEIEKLVEVQKTSPTPTTTVVSDNKKDNTNREVAIAEANITKIFEIIKQEYKYTNSVDNNKIAYTKLLKDVIQEKLNKTPEIKEENTSNQENVVEQTIIDNSPEITKEDKAVVSQQNENVQENKKEERKYPEEVTKKSLGIGIKFK